METPKRIPLETVPKGPPLPFSIPSSFPPSLRSRAAGVFLFGLMGDALGAPIESWTPGEIRDGYGLIDRFQLGRHMGLRLLPPRRGMYTDDGNFMLALASSLVENRGVNAKAIALQSANYHFDDILPKRGTTYSTERHLQRVVDSWPIRNIGTSEYSDGKFSNGGAMRIGPLGVLYRNIDDEKILREAVRLSLLATHVHPKAVDGACVIAKLVSVGMSSWDNAVVSEEEGGREEDQHILMMMRKVIEREIERMIGVQPSSLLGRGREGEEEKGEEEEEEEQKTTRMLPLLSSVLKYARSNRVDSNIVSLLPHQSQMIYNLMDEDIDFLRKLLGSHRFEFQIRATDAVCTALVSLLRYGWTNPLLAMQMVLGYGGDTDTTACILGYVLGAFWGEEALPDSWVEGLENGPRGRDFARNLAVQLSEIEKPAVAIVGEEEEEEEGGEEGKTKGKEEEEEQQAWKIEKGLVGDLSDEQKKVYRSYVTSLCQIESVSCSETFILDYIEGEVRQMMTSDDCPFSFRIHRDNRMGFAVGCDPDSLGGDDESMWKRKEDARPATLFVAHCDQVWDQGVITPVFHEGPDEFGLIEATALDDKACCAVLLTLLRTLSSTPNVAPFVFFFSVQEEIGRNGARAFALSIDPTVTFGLPVGGICVMDVSPGWVVRGEDEGRESEMVAAMADSEDPKATPFQRIVTVYESNPREGGWREGTRRFFPLLGSGAFPTRQSLTPFHLGRMLMLTDGQAFREFQSLYKSLPIVYSGVPCVALHKKISFASLRDCYEMLADVRRLVIDGCPPLLPTDNPDYDFDDLQFEYSDDGDDDDDGDGFEMEEEEEEEEGEDEELDTDDLRLLEELSPETLAAIQEEARLEVEAEEEGK